MGSGFRTWTAGETVTASNMNNYLQEQVVMKFASTGARDTAITSPEEGMVAYIGSGDANEGLYVYDGSNWRKGPGWNSPWGYIGSSIYAAADQNNLSGTTAITNVSVTFTAVANRYYLIHALAHFHWDGTCQVTLNLRKGGSTLSALAKDTRDTTNDQSTLIGFYVDTPAAGSVTYDLSATVSTSTADVQNTVVPTRMLVEDIGAAGAPP